MEFTATVTFLNDVRLTPDYRDAPRQSIAALVTEGQRGPCDSDGRHCSPWSGNASERRQARIGIPLLLPLLRCCPYAPRNQSSPPRPYRTPRSCGADALAREISAPTAARKQE